MLEPLLLTIAVVTVPFGLYLAFDRKQTDKRVQRRISRHENTRQAMLRLSQKEAHWNISHLRFEVRQTYRAVQKARQAGDWDALCKLAAVPLVADWRKDHERLEMSGLQWFVEPLEIMDVQPVNLQNRPGFAKDFVTLEIETRSRIYVKGPEGYYQEGSGDVVDSPEQIPIELGKEYWTFVRREADWFLVRVDRSFPTQLAFVDEESPPDENG